MVLLRLEERHCKWEVIVCVAIEFVDSVDFVDNVLGNFVEHFKATKTIRASVEFSGEVFECCTIVLVECDALT